MDIVRVEDLRYRYGSRTALDGVSFHVEKGEIFGLLGPNGGGKSTAFRILSTFLKPDSGTVRIHELDPATQSNEVRKRIGVVFQSGSLDKKLTVEENLVHQGHLYQMRGSSLKARIQELLLKFGLKDRSREMVQTLSGGLQRRVDIAKGLLHKPALLLLDEPSTGLDPAVRLELWDYLEELRKQDEVSILMTTHFLEEAERCDRLAILDRGSVVAVGTPQDLKAQVGGEVISIQTRTAKELLDILHKRFGVKILEMNGSLRMETPQGHNLIPTLMEEFGNHIDSITIGKPTLEDVFIHVTGHKLKSE